MHFVGGYYTIEQTKSRLRIIVLNTNYMRHDVKYSSHLSAVRQRPDGSLIMQQQQQQQQQHNMGYHRKHYHHDNENHNINNNFNRYNNDNKYYGSSMYLNNDERMGYPRDISLNSDNGGTVSALSGSSHESEKQWEWLEEVLAKSSKNRETVSITLKRVQQLYQLV